MFFPDFWGKGCRVRLFEEGLSSVFSDSWGRGCCVTLFEQGLFYCVRLIGFAYKSSFKKNKKQKQTHSSTTEETLQSCCVRM